MKCAFLHLFRRRKKLQVLKIGIYILENSEICIKIDFEWFIMIFISLSTLPNISGFRTESSL